MDKELRELYQTNDDVIFIISSASKIGWNEMKPQSLNRIIYLSKVLYSFVNQSEPNIMEYYHFTSNISGPVSSIVNNSLIYLESSEFIINKNSGIKLNINEAQLSSILDITTDNNKKNRQEWFRIVILLLGRFGENKIFSFAINDPLYIENIESNSSKEISFENEENKTLTVLNSFKKAFEKSIQNTASISRQEYLEFYFDYIFSQIIK